MRKTNLLLLRSIILLASIAIVGVVLSGCGQPQPDLPANNPTKISKLHNLNQSMHKGPGTSGASAPSSATSTP